MENGNLLFESIFKRKLSAPDTHDFLIETTSEYPYFSPAHFFLLLKTEKETPLYGQQVAKTAVLFNNSYWLQFQLQEMELGDTEVGEAGEVIASRDNTQQAAGEVPEVTPSNDDAGQLDIAKDNEEGPMPDGEFLQAGEELPILQPFETDQEIPEKEVESPVEEVPPAEAEVSEAEPTQKNNAAPVSATENTTLIEKPMATVEEKTADLDSTNKHTEIAGQSYNGHFNNENVPLVNETDAENDPVPDPEIEPLNFKLNIDTSNTTEDKITFEPLHTSDYFASLGIKLSNEIKPGDKLGKQLKSFTEWLKTMKKIHNDELPPLSGQADTSIQKLAEQSNREDAVLTEAMADVLLKQGKADKAIEVYKKLSLLNPSKSTYFAAKIEQLKEQ